MSAPFPLGLAGAWPAAVSALALGAAFGVALERAGLGSARKLMGQFYGTDFAVFQVMFTAIVVAMTGLVALEAGGLLDAGRLYVAPTHLLPQVIGGIVFGVGFVVGGYCPGTGCVGAASGRLDGLAAVAGLVVGTWVFGELFGAIRGFYEATPLGPLTIPDLTGLPAWIVVALFDALALAAFTLLRRFET